MRWAVLAAALALFASTAARAEDFAIMGYGVSLCDKYTDHLSQDNGTWQSLYFGWAQGFMSGLNSAAIVDKVRTRNLASKTIDEEKTFLREYCAAHPTEHFEEAVLELFKSLDPSSYDP